MIKLQSIGQGRVVQRLGLIPIQTRTTSRVISRPTSIIHHFQSNSISSSTPRNMENSSIAVPQTGARPVESDPSSIPVPVIKVNEGKARGYEFYKNVLKSPKYVVAPMVDGSELSWRMLSRLYGAELCYTPMIHSALFSDPRQVKYTHEQFDLQADEEGHPALDRPLIVQFCSNHPQTLLKAANIIVHHHSSKTSGDGNGIGNGADRVVDGVDLNLGCPQGIAKKGKYGAFLMDHLELISELIKNLDLNLEVPVTAKYRRFDDVEKTESYTQRLIEAGSQMISIHGRTREQKGQFTGLADWEMMRRAVECSHGRGIPILGNGNILISSDVTDMMEYTGADGAMVAEGNLYNPAIFAPLNQDFMVRYRDCLPDRFKLGLDRVDEEFKDPTGLLGTIDSLLEFPNSTKVARQYLCICATLVTRTATSAIKGHLHKLFRAVFDTGRYDDLRTLLAQISWASTIDPSSGDNNLSKKKTDRAGYEAVLERFQDVVTQIKLRLEEDRRTGLLDEGQIDMSLKRREGETTPGFLERLRVPYSRCQPHVRALAGVPTGDGVVEGGSTELVGCANPGCVNSGAAKCAFKLCKSCCSARSLDESAAVCEVHLRRAQLEKEKRKIKSERRKNKNCSTAKRAKLCQ
ncbi:hypothetical protein PSTG_08182 [Puccinia striiformis f. sp. tritici PST-78]|uniref:tRNA-dihydrouridine(16/17) synthase [NAD(P)(+)] n=1 Tax=Puccinia striiformis f. sp. tritici PST-78 TaxID=1165861 RepID=A0A0L0VHD6_9BASI|nr:hypothetical protein PSTG_08182 [Puccinia striiformis f. sp. tritici PST-78]